MKKPLRIPRHKTGNGVKLVVKETEWESVNWIYLA
jgi:hypothetical protein